MAEYATKSDITYYVNGTSGVDTNDGLNSATAFKTISKAVSKIPHMVNHDVVINVATGAYTEDVKFNSHNWSGTVTINGIISTLSSRISYK